MMCACNCCPVSLGEQSRSKQTLHIMQNNLEVQTYVHQITFLKESKQNMKDTQLSYVINRSIYCNITDVMYKESLSHDIIFVDLRYQLLALSLHLFILPKVSLVSSMEWRPSLQERLYLQANLKSLVLKNRAYCNQVTPSEKYRILQSLLLHKL